MTAKKPNQPLELAAMWKTFDYRDGQLIRRSTGKPTGYKMKSGYLQVGIYSRLEYAHRIIFLMFYGYLPDEVDHISGDRTNNKIENLRASILMTNQWNRKMKAINTSGYKGVYWHKQRERWHASIEVNHKKYSLGLHDTAEQAADAYMRASIALHGEYSLFNRDACGIIPHALTTIEKL
jgi:hypothetical protein